jgi:hypothetical protein
MTGLGSRKVALEQGASTVNFRQTPSIALSSAALSFTNFLLGHCTVAQKRAELVVNEIGAVATALRANWIDGEEACAHLRECGLLDFVITERSS